MPFYDSLAKINSNRRARPILVIAYTSIFSKNFCNFLPDTNAIRSKEENPIKSPALRHFAWNIGERLDIPLIDRAKFIKEIFPHELGSATIEYLSKNLRDSVTSKIKIDVPENGDYQFDCMRNFADGKISSC